MLKKKREMKKTMLEKRVSHLWKTYIVRILFVTYLVAGYIHMHTHTQTRDTDKGHTDRDTIERSDRYR